MDPNTGGTPTTVTAPRGYVLSGKLMLSGIVVLLAIAIFLLFLHLYVRWHVLRRHDRRRRRNRLVFAAASAEEEDRNRSAPRGLDKEVLNSLPTELFSDRDDAEEDDAECAVCLSEFDEGEKVRALPRCGHRFHVGCIDMWFGTHSTCPLCRCAIEAVKSPPAPAAESGEGSAVVELAVSDPSPRIREVRIEIPEESGSSTSTEAVPAVKLPGHRRISSIRRFFIGDVRAESTDRASPPPPPPPPPPATAQ